MFRAFVGQTLIPSSSSSALSSSPHHIRTCRCLFARFRFMCLFCFYEHKDKFTRSVGVQPTRLETAQVDCPRYFPPSSLLSLSSFPFMRFYLFIYSNKLQCQLNHRTLLVFRFSLLRPLCPPFTSTCTVVGQLIFGLYRKSLFLFALRVSRPLSPPNKTS